jgi:hypothetical protein
MFSLPTLPTDSLYKFCFVSGIILLLFSVFLKFSANKITFQATEDRKIINEDFRIDSVINSRTTVEDSLKGYQSLKLSEIKKEDYPLYKLRPVDSSSINRLSAMRKKNNENIIRLNDALHFYDYSNSLLALSLVMIAYGGGFWFHNVQKIQDRLLKVQLNTAQIELELAQLNLDKVKSEHLPQQQVSPHTNS